jgi:geranylgeranyl pyrophosphate synthase
MDDPQKNRLREAFRESMPLPAMLEPHLRVALERILQNPGSMIRPEIVHQVALAYHLPESASTDMAIGLEYFHTASLLFDDLPAMDDALERRGTPCIHVEFGDAGAMLAALALVNRAYALTWRSVAAGLPATQRRALEYVECHLGVDGLLNGQSMDLHYASLPHDQQTTQRTAIGKTVSLIRLTLVLPAMISGASEEELQLLERVALFWGLSYQIVDDLKDVLQGASESGKTPYRDLVLNRPNLALTLGIERAAERLDRLIGMGDRTLERLVAMRPALAFLRDLRFKLGEEAAQLTQNAYAPALGAAAP